MGNNELSATVRAEVVALLYGRPADANRLEPIGGRAYWRSKARASPLAYGLRRLRRDGARGRLVAQLMGDSQRDAEERIDSALAGSFPASDPPYWTLGVKRRPGLEAKTQEDDDTAATVSAQPSLPAMKPSRGGRLV
jgi:hypothetical protein